jgi:hypothetical protein
VPKPYVSPSQADARPTPLPFQRLKEKNVPTGSDDTSKLDSVAARNYIKRGPSLSTISTGSSVRNSKINYPAIPKYLGGDKHCACPYCARPLEAERVLGHSQTIRHLFSDKEREHHESGGPQRVQKPAPTAIQNQFIESTDDPSLSMRHRGGNPIDNFQM